MGNSLTTWEFSGDANKALAELRKIQDLNRELEKQLKKQSQATDKMADRYEGQLKNQAKQIGNLITKNQDLERAQKGVFEAGIKGFSQLKTAVAAAGVIATLKQMITLQQDFNRELARQAFEQDKIGRKAQVQGLISNPQFQADLRKRIAPIADKFAIPLADAQMGVTELLNQGVDKKDAMGGVLSEVIAGSLATGTSATAFGGGVVGLLRSRNEAVTPESVRQVSAMLAGAFEKNRITGEDIGQLSQIGALSGATGVSKSELLAGFTTLRHEGNLDAGQATTAMRNIITHMATAGAKKGKLGANLEMIGGKGFAKEFDLIGESFPQALANLTAGLENAAPEKRVEILKQMFGDENIAAATTLLSRGGIKNFQTKQQQMAGGEAVLQKGLDLATSGIGPARIRAQNRLEMAQLDRSQVAVEQEIANLIADRKLAESGAPGFAIGGIQGLREAGMGAVFDAFGAGNRHVPAVQAEMFRMLQGAGVDNRNVKPEGATDIQWRDFSEAAAAMRAVAAELKAQRDEKKQKPEDKPAKPTNRGANR